MGSVKKTDNKTGVGGLGSVVGVPRNQLGSEPWVGISVVRSKPKSKFLSATLKINDLKVVCAIDAAKLDRSIRKQATVELK